MAGVVGRALLTVVSRGVTCCCCCCGAGVRQCGWGAFLIFCGGMDLSALLRKGRCIGKAAWLSSRSRLLGAVSS